MKTLVMSIFLATCVMMGCESGPSYRVDIVTNPPGAFVKIAPLEKALGKKSYATPYSKTLRFSDTETKFRIEAHPTGMMSENFLVTEMIVTENTMLSDNPNAQEITVELDPRPWIDMRSYELIFDPTLGWRGFQTKDRAYEYVLESGDVRAKRKAGIFSPEDTEYDGFRGVRLSPNGDEVVFATFKLDPIEHMPTKSILKNLEKKGEDISEYVPRMEWLHPIKHSHIRTQHVEGIANNYPVRDGTNFDPALFIKPDGKGLLYAFDSTGEGDSVIHERPLIHGIINTHITNHYPREGACYPSFHYDKNDLSKYHYIFTLFPSGWETLADARLKVLSDTYNQVIDLDIGMHPTLSPDRKRIAHIRNGDLWIIGSGGTGGTQLTTNAKKITALYADSLKDSPEDIARWENYERDRLFLPNSYPSWSPDGKWIIFTSMSVSDETGKPQQDIFAIEAHTGRNLFRLTTNYSADRMPMISPDGKSFYFVSNRGKQWAVWNMPLPELMWPKN